MSALFTYDCPLANNEHAVPGSDVRVMKAGDGGFIIACNCSAEALDDVDATPHPTTDHLVNVYGDDPSPEEWLVLEDAADGWYDTTAWNSSDDFDGTHGQRRAAFREQIKELADESDENRRGGADETDEDARAVPCPNCDAGAEQKCKRPSGHRVRKSHQKRVQKAIDEGVIEGDDQSESTQQRQLDAYAGGASS